jgi:hypothetical protein
MLPVNPLGAFMPSIVPLVLKVVGPEAPALRYVCGKQVVPVQEDPPAVAGAPVTVRPGLEAAPAEVKVPVEEALTVVNCPEDGVVDPIGPGAANVVPFKNAAFRLGTAVVLVTVKGGVPIATVETRTGADK